MTTPRRAQYRLARPFGSQPGLGSTEAALIAVLAGPYEPASHAAEQVLIFRLVTFWLPALLGVVVSRHLYRRDAL